MPFSARTRISKSNDGVDTAIILFDQCPRCLLFFFVINEHSIFMALLFYQIRMLEKVTMQRTQQLSDFFFFTGRTQLTAARA